MRCTGQQIRRGDRIFILIGSANRDGDVFDGPDELLLDRAPNRHLSFGYGIHFCLGAALARMEGRIGLEETLRRFPEWEVDHEHVVRLHTSTVRGFAQVPIRV